MKVIPNPIPSGTLCEWVITGFIIIWIGPWANFPQYMDHTVTPFWQQWDSNPGPHNLVVHFTLGTLWLFLTLPSIHCVAFKVKMELILFFSSLAVSQQAIFRAWQIRYMKTWITIVFPTQNECFLVPVNCTYYRDTILDKPLYHYIFFTHELLDEFVAEWLRRWTPDQVTPFGVGSNPTAGGKLFPRSRPGLSFF